MYVLTVLKRHLGVDILEQFVLDFERGWLHRLNVKAGHGTTLFYRLVPLLVREATIVETSVAAEDFSRDNRAVNSRMEKQLTAATDSYMTDGLSTTAFLRKCAALYTCRLDGAEEDEARDQ
ncbi:uncharacterized protein LOC110447304 [Mizuhopecten yessoensis]|uniref:uncharacterized protein LOC110447304 n=1 Tax=Mizuhopecten yessoensis TaxID=6573 RepID=UPI000B457B5F|nr:uncharacterized protein LOC110447304 [Mizuhopecten yessoensis]